VRVLLHVRVPEFEVIGWSVHEPSRVSIMEAIDASVSMLSNDPDWAHLNDLPRPFDVVCEDLAALGALSLQDFLSGSTSNATDFDVSFHLQSIVSSLPEKGTSTSEAAEESQRAGDVAPTKFCRPAVPLLNQTSQRIFGSTDAIKFEFLEEDPKSHIFIHSLTILMTWLFFYR